MNNDDTSFHPAFLITLGCATALTVGLLCLRIFPAYIDQGITHIAGLALFIAILIEGARNRRLCLPPGAALILILLFPASQAISFFLSDLDKYYLSPAALVRLLWVVFFWASFVLCQPGHPARSLYAAGLVGSTAILSVQTARVQGEELLILMGTWSVGLVIFLMGIALKSRPADSSPDRGGMGWIKAIAAAGLLLVVWSAGSYFRLGGGEISLVRGIRQEEKAVVQVSRDMFRGNLYFGAGPGSIDRKFLESRPPDATIQGVSDRLGAPPQSFAVILGETGAAGLIGFLCFIVTPCFIGRRVTSVTDAGLWACYGAVLAHDALGGGWAVSFSGGALLAALAGAICGRSMTEFRSESVPVGVYVSGLMVSGGILLLQQIYFWKTCEVEQKIKESAAALATGYLVSAGNLGNEVLFLDSKRNEVISLMIGALNRAGITDRALENSAVLLARDPLYPSVKNNIGAFYMMKRNAVAALPYIEETAERHPTVENLAKLGHLQLVTSQTDSALRSFRRALETLPREADLLVARAGYVSDSTVQAQALLDAAAFSANYVLQAVAQTGDAQARQKLLEQYQRVRNRLIETIGILPQDPRRRP